MIMDDGDDVECVRDGTECQVTGKVSVRSTLCKAVWKKNQAGEGAGYDVRDCQK